MPATASLPFYLVDAFVVEEEEEEEEGGDAGGAAAPSACPFAPLTGNPAAVVLIPPGTPAPLPHAALAAEFAQSETAFVQVSDQAATTGHGLRWFTPTGVEVGMCGHATLAAAAGLGAAGLTGGGQGGRPSPPLPPCPAR